MTSAVRVLLVGAGGRLGQAISKASEEHEQLRIVARCGRDDDVRTRVTEADVVIDVSRVEAAQENCAATVEAHKPLVIGTTGHSREQLKIVEEAARAIPIVLAPNFSIGVNTLFWLARHAAELLGDGFDIEIIETHHRLKKDAPSGTAKRLAELLADVRALRYDEDVAHGRQGLTGEGPRHQIGMHAIRAGDVVGDHTVVFAGTGERLELTHKASSRDTFAVGALRAAQWVINQPAGLYSMEDVLGLTGGAR